MKESLKENMAEYARLDKLIDELEKKRFEIGKSIELEVGKRDALFVVPDANQADTPCDPSLGRILRIENGSIHGVIDDCVVL